MPLTDSPCRSARTVCPYCYNSTSIFPILQQKIANLKKKLAVFRPSPPFAADKGGLHTFLRAGGLFCTNTLFAVIRVVIRIVIAVVIRVIAAVIVAAVIVVRRIVRRGIRAVRGIAAVRSRAVRRGLRIVLLRIGQPVFRRPGSVRWCSSHPPHPKRCPNARPPRPSRAQNASALIVPVQPADVRKGESRSDMTVCAKRMR